MCIDWVNSIGFILPFIYNNVSGNIKIISYEKKSQFLIVEYNNMNYRIKSGNLINCKLGGILGIISSQFKLEIGINIKDDKRDLTIIDRKYEKNKNNQQLKWYKYHCNKCGAELWIEESPILKQKIGCSCCYGRTTVRGINDIATTQPWMVKYFVNIEDAYTHTYCSGDKILCKCNICGHKKEIVISNLYRQGFSCPKCSDGISYPEKFMYNLLSQLNINFIFQFTKKYAKWVGKYRYDFYFEHNNESYIVETHGLQHYNSISWNNNTNSLKEEQENDNNKYELAVNNGIKPENYIVIDCRYSEFEFIKNNIIQSIFNEIFDLNSINWNNIEKKCQNLLVKEVCEFWKLHNEINCENLIIKQISNILNLSVATIRKYLKIGAKLGWCHYNPKEEMKKSSSKTGKKRGKQVEIFKNGISLGIFSSCHELARESEKLFGVKLLESSISKSCNNFKKYKGYNFNYLK